MKRGEALRTAWEDFCLWVRKEVDPMLPQTDLGRIHTQDDPAHVFHQEVHRLIHEFKWRPEQVHELLWLSKQLVYMSRIYYNQRNGASVN